MSTEAVNSRRWHIYGQDHLLKRLESSLARGRQAHAYLLSGPPHVGKMALAISLAQAVNCLKGPGIPCGQCTQCTRILQGLHADVRTVKVGQGEDGRGARTMIGINSIRDVLHSVNLNPYEGTAITIIVDGAEAMTDDAANALLKTLEEPPPQVMFLLLTSNEEAVLPTIRSRCQSLALLPLSKPQMIDRLTTDRQVSPEEAEKLYRLSRGCAGWALGALDDFQVLEQWEADLERMIEVLNAGLETRFTYANEIASLFSSDRDSARELLASWLRWWRDLLLIKEGAEEYLQNADHAEALRSQAAGLSTAEVVRFIRRIMDTISALDRNVSARLALEVLMLNLPIEASTL